VSGTFAAPSEFRRRTAEQAAGLEVLQDDVSDLPQVIAGFEPYRVGAEKQVPVQAAILLTNR
jgi:hypothetical protein